MTPQQLADMIKRDGTPAIGEWVRTQVEQLTGDALLLDALDTLCGRAFVADFVEKLRREASIETNDV